MIILCFLVMRGRSGSMICGLGSRERGNHKGSDSDSAMEILDKRYALGKLNEKEYEEKQFVRRPEFTFPPFVVSGEQRFLLGQ
jgi:uncharacterized membrane protein